MDRFDSYIEGVMSGRIVTGRLIRQAVQRHLDDLQNPKFYFDRAHADKVIKVCEICRHWKGAKAKERIHLEEWQIFYIACLFGWKRSKDGLRKYTQSYMQVARKNGKTTLLALISIIHLLLDKEQGAQVWCGATKEDQARILVNDAGQITQSTPELKKLFKGFMYKDLITRVSYSTSQSFIAALGRDSRTQDGFDPSVGNIDEFHEHSTTQLLNVIVSGQGARMQPLLNIITTAGFNKDYPCYSVTRKTGIEILDGIKRDDSYLILIYEPDEGDEWSDKSTWVKSNPNLNVSVRPEFLVDKLKTAKNEGGSTEVNFKTKHLNIWTDAPKVWIADEIWMSNTIGKPEIELKGRICYGGLDLAKSRDLNSFVLLFPTDGQFYVRAWHWIPQETLDKEDKESYNRWVQDGWLNVFRGNVMRPDDLAGAIMDICKDYKIESIAYDPYLATHGTIQILDDNNFVLSPLAQGIRHLSPHTKEFERLVYSAQINHMNNPILRWMMSNVVTDTDTNGNIKINKQKSGNKIDGIAATINALAQYTEFKEDVSSIYNKQDIRVI
jgi:phage terminase large subunit-like protein